MLSGKYHFKHVNVSEKIASVSYFASNYADVCDCSKGSCDIKMQLYDLIICLNTGLMHT